MSKILTDDTPAVVQIPVRLPPEDYEKLRNLAFRDRTSMAHIVRYAVKSFLRDLEGGTDAPLR